MATPSRPSSAGSKAGATGKPRRNGAGLIIGIPLLVICLIFLIGWFTSEGDEGESASGNDGQRVARSEQRSDSQARSTRASAELQAQTTCPPFRREGATCEVTPTAGSGWIYEAPGLPRGLTHTIMPAPDAPGTAADQRVWSEIRYLDCSGQEHVFEPGSMPACVIGWKFRPTRPVTMSYGAIG